MYKNLISSVRKHLSPLGIEVGVDVVAPTMDMRSKIREDLGFEIDGMLDEFYGEIGGGCALSWSDGDSGPSGGFFIKNLEQIYNDETDRRSYAFEWQNEPKLDYVRNEKLAKETIERSKRYYNIADEG